MSTPLRHFAYAKVSHPSLCAPPQSTMTPQDIQILEQSTQGPVRADGLRRSALVWELYFLPKYADHPYFALLVANVRATLGSHATALIMYKQAQQLVGAGSDPTFDRFLESYTHIAARAATEQCADPPRPHSPVDATRSAPGGIYLTALNQGPLTAAAAVDMGKPDADKPFCQPFKHTRQHVAPHMLPLPPAAAPALKERWERLMQSGESGGDEGGPEGANGDAVSMKERFLRLYCVESNQIDNVFILTEQSTREIVSHGFREELVCCTDGSPVKSAEAIAQILDDMRKTILKVMPMTTSNDASPLSLATIAEAHGVLMKHSTVLVLSPSNNYSSNKDIISNLNTSTTSTNSNANANASTGIQSPIANGGPERNSAEAPVVPDLRYTNAGKTRSTTRTLGVLDTGGVHRCGTCPHAEVDVEVEYICRMARQWIRNFRKQNPFSVAAWMHLVLDSCHPFEDGNGRLVRLIASIPLVMQGFPPISIPREFRKEYYGAVHKARDGDLAPLAECFLRGMESTMAKLEQIMQR